MLSRVYQVKLQHPIFSHFHQRSISRCLEIFIYILFSQRRGGPSLPVQPPYIADASPDNAAHQTLCYEVHTVYFSPPTDRDGGVHGLRGLLHRGAVLLLGAHDVAARGRGQRRDRQDRREGGGMTFGADRSVSYCFGRIPALSNVSTRPATPRTKFRLRTAHPGGFLRFSALFSLKAGRA